MAHASRLDRACEIVAGLVRVRASKALATQALLDALQPDDLALLPYCHDLLTEETPPGWSVVWDLVMLEGTLLLYTRRSIDPPPLDIADGREAAAWLSLSVTAIDRQIASRLARSGSPS